MSCHFLFTFLLKNMFSLSFRTKSHHLLCQQMSLFQPHKQSQKSCDTRKVLKLSILRKPIDSKQTCQANTEDKQANLSTWLELHYDDYKNYMKITQTREAWQMVVISSRVSHSHHETDVDNEWHERWNCSRRLRNTCQNDLRTWRHNILKLVLQFTPSSYFFFIEQA